MSDQPKRIAAAIRDSAAAVLRVSFPQLDDQALERLARELGNNCAQSVLFALDEDA